MKKKLLYLFYSLLFFLPLGLLAQTPVTLTSSPYTENFDNIGNALPNGFGVYLSATSSSLGTSASANFISSATTATWSATGAGFKNYASADGQTSGLSTANQATATNRALGVRQTSSTGYDPGASFIFQIANTTGKTGFKLSFALQSLDISMTVTRTTTWVVDYGFGASPTSFTTATPVGTMTTGNMVFSDNTITIDFGNALDNQSGIVTIRISALATTTGSGSRASTGIDDFSLTWSGGTSTTPTLTTSVPSLDFGTTQTVNTTSAAQTFTVSGANLTAGASLTATGPFTISTDGTTYGTTASIASAFTTAQTVYVKFTPTTTTPATGSISIASTNATTQTVNLTGTGAAAVPSLTASASTLAFGNVNTAGTPSVLSYTLTGANLGTNNTTVATTAPYLVSKSSTTGFASSISFTPTELASTPTVYVQFTPTSAGSAPGSVTNTNTAVTSGPSVTLTGTGVTPTLTSSVSTLAFGNLTINTTSGAQTFTLSAANLIASATLTTAAPYTISTDGGNTYNTTATITAATLASAQTIMVKFAPTTLGAANGSISIASTGAATQTVTLTGTSVSAPVPALTLTPTTLTFSQLLGSAPVAQSYTVSGANLTGNTTITTAAPYSIATSSTGTYGTSITFTTAQLATTQTVYVQFNPTVVGAANGSISNVTAGGSTQTVTLNGTGIGVPVLAASPSSLTFTQSIASPSAAQSFSLTGSYLTAAATTVTVAAPYQLSKDGVTNWVTSLTYTASDFPPTGTASLNVFVRFAPTVIATGGVNNGTATIISAGAISQSVTLNGTGVGVPSLTVTPAALTFNQAAGTTSAAQTYTLSGAYLTGTTTVATTAPYSISKDGVTYSTSVTYSVTDLASAQTVYVKFAPTAIGAYPATITNTTTGASQTITLTGNGGNSAPTLAAIANQAICYTTTPQSIALSNITPGLESTQTTTVSVTSNNPNLFAQLGAFQLVGATTGQLNYTIANGAIGTATVTVKVQDNGGTANGGVDTYTTSFTITVNALPNATITTDIGTTITKGNTVNLTAAPGGTTYSWAAAADIISGQSTATLTVRPHATTTYTVTVTNATGCTTTQSVTITVNTFSPLVTTNILTPNGDGKNDTWTIINIDYYPNNSVKVVDKAGKVVYSKTGYTNDWDGTYNGTPLTQGTYYYVVDLGTGAPKYTGYITLIRN